MKARPRKTSPTPVPNPIDRFPSFVEAVQSRLDAGRLQYGDASFTRDPAALLGELGQEALDLAGWGFVLWTRIEAAKKALAKPGTGLRVDTLNEAVDRLLVIVRQLVPLVRPPQDDGITRRILLGEALLRAVGDGGGKVITVERVVEDARAVWLTEHPKGK